CPASEYRMPAPSTSVICAGLLTLTTSGIPYNVRGTSGAAAPSAHATVASVIGRSTQRRPVPGVVFAASSALRSVAIAAAVDPVDVISVAPLVIEAGLTPATAVTVGSRNC